MKKTRIIGLALAGLLSLNGIGAFALTGDRTFTNFDLPVNNGNSYTTNREKETNRDFSYVKCTELSGTDKATFWIDVSKTRISEYVTIGENSSYYTLYYSVDKSKGDKVRLGMENYYDDDGVGKASGKVDYK